MAPRPTEKNSVNMNGKLPVCAACETDLRECGEDIMTQCDISDTMLQEGHEGDHMALFAHVLLCHTITQDAAVHNTVHTTVYYHYKYTVGI